MDEQQEQPDRYRKRIPGMTMPNPPGRLSPRESGLHRVRRLSNWSLAALVVGVGASTAALARTIPVATTGTVTSATPSLLTGSSTGSSTSTGQAPTLTGPVATTSASGVTTAVAAPGGRTPSIGSVPRSTSLGADS